MTSTVQPENELSSNDGNQKKAAVIVSHKVEEITSKPAWKISLQRSTTCERFCYCNTKIICFREVQYLQ